MQSQQQIAKQLVKTRIAQSVDVSGAFDNCFFHCYAAHLLTNSLPLPDDLFRFDSVLGADSNASKLQSLFPNEDSLSVFEDFDRMVNSRPKSPTHLVEKTMVLGHLLREWFATQMANNLEHRDEMLQGSSGVISIFKGYKEIRPMMESKEDLYTGPEANIYAANAGFLEYFTARPDAPQQEKYEKYFRQAGGNVDRAISAYWKAEGYQAYCQFIAEPGVKLSFNDVTPVMEQTLRQPLTIYSSTGDAQVHTGGDHIPRMEISLDAQAGHYHLLKTEANTVELDQYARSNLQYRTDREAVLGTRDKLAAAEQRESLLVGATCPRGHVPKDPFTLLTEKVEQMQSVVAENVVDRGPKKKAEPIIDELTVTAPKVTSPKVSSPTTTTTLANTNYGFILDAASSVSKKIGYLPLSVAAFTMGAVLTFTTASVGTALAAGVFTGGATFQRFKDSNRELRGNDDGPSDRFNKGL